MCKAEDWRFFVLQSSLHVFDGELDEEVMEVWHLFVKIMDRCTRPTLTASDVNCLGDKSTRFYTFYEEYFYDGNPYCINTCKVTVHFILHLADSVESCEPLLNVSQFLMETFIGETVQ